MTEHTPTPWDLCHHLQSIEKDASCGCGYRGGIWGAGGEVLVCEMGNCSLHEGHDMINIGDRPMQLANAAFIVEAVNNHEALKARVKELEATLECVDQCIASTSRYQIGYAQKIARKALDRKGEK